MSWLTGTLSVSQLDLGVPDESNRIEVPCMLHQPCTMDGSAECGGPSVLQPDVMSLPSPDMAAAAWALVAELDEHAAADHGGAACGGSSAGTIGEISDTAAGGTQVSALQYAPRWMLCDDALPQEDWMEVECEMCAGSSSMRTTPAVGPSWPARPLLPPDGGPHEGAAARLCTGVQGSGGGALAAGAVGPAAAAHAGACGSSSAGSIGMVWDTAAGGTQSPALQYIPRACSMQGGADVDRWMLRDDALPQEDWMEVEREMCAAGWTSVHAGACSSSVHAAPLAVLPWPAGAQLPPDRGQHEGAAGLCIAAQASGGVLATGAVGLAALTADDSGDEGDDAAAADVVDGVDAAPLANHEVGVACADAAVAAVNAGLQLGQGGGGAATKGRPFNRVGAPVPVLAPEAAHMRERVLTQARMMASAEGRVVRAGHAYGPHVSYSSRLERYAELLSVVASFLVQEGQEQHFEQLHVLWQRGPEDFMYRFTQYMVIKRYSACGVDHNGDKFVMSYNTTSDRLSRLLCYLATLRDQAVQALRAAAASASGGALHDSVAGASQAHDAHMAVHDGIIAALEARHSSSDLQAAAAGVAVAFPKLRLALEDVASAGASARGFDDYRRVKQLAMQRVEAEAGPTWRAQRNTKGALDHGLMHQGLRCLDHPGFQVACSVPPHKVLQMQAAWVLLAYNAARPGQILRARRDSRCDVWKDKVICSAGAVRLVWGTSGLPSIRIAVYRTKGRRQPPLAPSLTQQQYEAAPIMYMFLLPGEDCTADDPVLHLLGQMIAEGHFGVYDIRDAAAIEAHVRRVFEEQPQHCVHGAEGRPLFPGAGGKLDMRYDEVCSAAATVFAQLGVPKHKVGNQSWRKGACTTWVDQPQGQMPVLRATRHANLNSTTFPYYVDIGLPFDGTMLWQGRAQRQDVGMGRTQLAQQRVEGVSVSEARSRATLQVESHPECMAAEAAVAAVVQAGGDASRPRAALAAVRRRVQRQAINSLVQELYAAGADDAAVQREAQAHVVHPDLKVNVLAGATAVQVVIQRVLRHHGLPSAYDALAGGPAVRRVRPAAVTQADVHAWLGAGGRVLSGPKVPPGICALHLHCGGLHAAALACTSCGATMGSYAAARAHAQQHRQRGTCVTGGIAVWSAVAAWHSVSLHALLRGVAVLAPNEELTDAQVQRLHADVMQADDILYRHHGERLAVHSQRSLRSLVEALVACAGSGSMVRLQLRDAGSAQPLAGMAVRWGDALPATVSTIQFWRPPARRTARAACSSDAVPAAAGTSDADAVDAAAGAASAAVQPAWSDAGACAEGMMPQQNDAVQAAAATAAAVAAAAAVLGCRPADLAVPVMAAAVQACSSSTADALLPVASVMGDHGIGCPPPAAGIVSGQHSGAKRLCPPGAQVQKEKRARKGEDTACIDLTADDADEVVVARDVHAASKTAGPCVLLIAALPGLDVRRVMERIRERLKAEGLQAEVLLADHTPLLASSIPATGAPLRVLEPGSAAMLHQARQVAHAAAVAATNGVLLLAASLPADGAAWQPVIAVLNADSVFLAALAPPSAAYAAASCCVPGVTAQHVEPALAHYCAGPVTQLLGSTELSRTALALQDHAEAELLRHGRWLQAHDNVGTVGRVPRAPPAGPDLEASIQAVLRDSRILRCEYNALAALLAQQLYGEALVHALGPPAAWQWVRDALQQPLLAAWHLQRRRVPGVVHVFRASPTPVAGEVAMLLLKQHGLWRVAEAADPSQDMVECLQRPIVYHAKAAKPSETFPEAEMLERYQQMPQELTARDVVALYAAGMARSPHDFTSDQLAGMGEVLAHIVRPPASLETVLVLGPAGVGKTTLALALTTIASSRQVEVLATGPSNVAKGNVGGQHCMQHYVGMNFPHRKFNFSAAMAQQYNIPPVQQRDHLTHPQQDKRLEALFGLVPEEEIRSKEWSKPWVQKHLRQLQAARLVVVDEAGQAAWYLVPAFMAALRKCSTVLVLTADLLQNAGPVNNPCVPPGPEWHRTCADQRLFVEAAAVRESGMKVVMLHEYVRGPSRQANDMRLAARGFVTPSLEAILRSRTVPRNAAVPVDELDGFWVPALVVRHTCERVRETCAAGYDAVRRWHAQEGLTCREQEVPWAIDIGNVEGLGALRGVPASDSVRAGVAGKVAAEVADVLGRDAQDRGPRACQYIVPAAGRAGQSGQVACIVPSPMRRPCVLSFLQKETHAEES